MSSEGEIQQEPLSETRLRELVAHLPFFAVMIDREHRYIWVNRLDQTLELASEANKSVHPTGSSSTRPGLIDLIRDPLRF